MTIIPFPARTGRRYGDPVVTEALELEDEQVVAALDERARALGFVPQAQTLEVHGLCARCSG